MKLSPRRNGRWQGSMHSITKSFEISYMGLFSFWIGVGQIQGSSRGTRGLWASSWTATGRENSGSLQQVAATTPSPNPGPHHETPRRSSLGNLAFHPAGENRLQGIPKKVGGPRSLWFFQQVQKWTQAEFGTGCLAELRALTRKREPPCGPVRMGLLCFGFFFPVLQSFVRQICNR